MWWNTSTHSSSRNNSCRCQPCWPECHHQCKWFTHWLRELLSQIKREDLATVWDNCQTLPLLPSWINLADHYRPLETIFNKPTCKATERLERYKYSCTCSHKNSELFTDLDSVENPADYMSCHPVHNSTISSSWNIASSDSPWLAHSGHQGVVKTKSLLRETMWFPGMDKMVQERISQCIPCQTAKYVSSATWSLAGTFRWFLWSFPQWRLLTGTSSWWLYSRYPEVEILKSTSVKAVIPHLCQARDCKCGKNRQQSSFWQPGIPAS